jgi:hypothetical protein
MRKLVAGPVLGAPSEPHLPDDAERARQELSVQSVLGRSLFIVKGSAAAELEPVYARARELSAQIRDPALAFRPFMDNG